MRFFILDDNKDRHAEFDRMLAGHDLTHVFTATEAFKVLGSQTFDVALLDHDLGEYTENPPEFTTDRTATVEKRSLRGCTLPSSLPTSQRRSGPSR